MKFAFCNELFGDRPFAQTCQVIADAGYDGIELAPFTLARNIDDLTPGQRARIRKTAEDAGLEVVGLHWLLAKTEGMHLTSDDAATRRRTALYLAELGRACHELGGSVMVFGSPQQRSLPIGTDLATGIERAVEVFRRALPAFADLGVRLCIEPLSDAETDFVTTCAVGERLVSAVDHPAFGIHLDVKAMCCEPTPIEELIRRHGERAFHFHANDRNLRGPGFGETDFRPIFSALAASGYQGWVSVEVFDPTPGIETVAIQSLQYMRACCR